MRRFIPSLVAAVMLASILTFAFVGGASAHTMQQASQTSQHVQFSSHHGTPNVDGGGCNDKTNGVGDIRASACISYSYPYLLPDGYATFHPASGHGGVDSCRFRLQIWHGTSLLDQEDFNCAYPASKGIEVHYGPLSIYATAGDNYYTVVQINLKYADGYATLLVVQSPNQNIS